MDKAHASNRKLETRLHHELKTLTKFQENEETLYQKRKDELERGLRIIDTLRKRSLQDNEKATSEFPFGKNLRRKSIP